LRHQSLRAGLVFQKTAIWNEYWVKPVGAWMSPGVFGLNYGDFIKNDSQKTLAQMGHE
jgi:hypothetical protein